ncbi:hypothetical protein E3N88_31033 [Mikania micrantha]|uniref:Uncharacterized protein n=1 Tax=Mikania micrantha TaxID=192012 RepID=A0A5N6MP77_9ASTR|nr:hypothetical protein E3N88_31033 [Mikania micrantha]
MVSFVAQPFGTPPNTLAGFALNQFNNLDFFDISLVDGFNVPMAFKPNSSGCTRGISCLGDINVIPRMIKLAPLHALVEPTTTRVVFCP